MNTQNPPLEEVHLQKWHKQNKKWTKEFDFYIDELTELKKQVNAKKVKDHIEIQVQKNITLIAKTTQDRLMKNLSNNLEKHKLHLTRILVTKNNLEVQNYQESQISLSRERKTVKRKLKSLKLRIFDFLNSESHVQRHKFSY